MQDQEYFVFAVRFEQKPEETTIVSARLTDTQGHQGQRVDTEPFYVDNQIWNGNASLISHTSGNQEGYGLNQDEGMIHASVQPPSIYAQWEVSKNDGDALTISGPSGQGTVRYGFWDDRSQDIIHSNVSFPFTINPVQDGLSITDGSYLVISVNILEATRQAEPVIFTLSE